TGEVLSVATDGTDVEALDSVVESTDADGALEAADTASSEAAGAASAPASASGLTDDVTAASG
ncbi:MAG: hypothetical protein VYB08_16015, partial [Candidatus Latescibacterota bacterium]|nr:hypothetical protein [Candidatus Latescibacterota bacterium]